MREKKKTGATAASLAIVELKYMQLSQKLGRRGISAPVRQRHMSKKKANASDNSELADTRSESGDLNLPRRD